MILLIICWKGKRGLGGVKGVDRKIPSSMLSLLGENCSLLNGYANCEFQMAVYVFCKEIGPSLKTVSSLELKKLSSKHS